MKILCLSLLRLGDSLMHLQLADDIQASYPNAEIHFAMNNAFAFSEDFLRAQNGNLRGLHFFPRSELQDNLVLKSGSLFSALNKLTGWIGHLQEQGFDRVIDLTHTRLSRALVQALEISELPATNPQFLNDVFSRSRVSTFHYRDSLRHHFDLGLGKSLRTVEFRSGNKVYIQMQTSDPKKNWSEQAWKSFLDEVHSARPDLELSVLGSESERASLRNFVQDRPWLNLAICNLQDLGLFLSEALALVSTDTMALHVAASSQTPIFGIYLGSAEPTKTAPWVEGAWIVQSVEACAPCVHSKPCHQERQHCSQSLDPVSLAQNFLAYLRRDSKNLKTGRFQLFETRKGYQENLILKNMEDSSSAAVQSLRQFCFSKDIGLSEAVDRFMDSLECEAWEKSVIVNELWTSHQRISEILKLFALELREISSEALQGQIFSKASWNTMKNWIREFRMLSDDPEWSSLFEESLKSSTEGSALSAFSSMKRVYELCEKFHSRQHQVLQILIKRLSQKGVFYVPGSSRHA